jgi:hypothetical protein
VPTSYYYFVVKELPKVGLIESATTSILLPLRFAGHASSKIAKSNKTIETTPQIHLKYLTSLAILKLEETNMPSDLQSETARANGAKSRGPKTPEGREKSSRNAIKHGFTSNSIMVLDSESPDRFHEILNDFYTTYQPASAVEKDLVEEMVAARWRIRRMWSVETGLLNGEIHNQETKIESPDSGVHLAAAFRTLADESHSLALNFRYASRLHRIYDSALKNLRELQQNRPPQPPEQETEVPTQPTDSEPPPAAEASPTQNCETNPAPPDLRDAPTEPRASASGQEPVVSIKIRARHPRCRASFQRAHRGFRLYFAPRRLAIRRLPYNENLLQATGRE